MPDTSAPGFAPCSAPVVTSVEALAERIWALPDTGARQMIALSGPPASGKSTISRLLATRFSDPGREMIVVPMDGFHLDNTILSRRDLLARKGAPETFDADGFLNAMRRLRHEDHVVLPDFDRASDRSIAGRIEVTARHRLVLVEGNYLCSTATPWDALRDRWDLCIALDLSADTLRQRLIRRWTKHGLPEADAIARAEGNDMVNARFVAETLATPDVVFRPPH